MRILRILFATLLCGYLAACATAPASNQVRVTINSEPPGAMIYWGDVAYGVAPRVVTFTLPPDAVQRGSLDEYKIRAIWPSGAEKKGIHLSLQIQEAAATFSRPPNAPGLDKDLAYAAQLQQVKAQQDQAAASSDTADTLQNLFLLWLSK